MYKQLLVKKDLINLGYSDYQSKEIIKQARNYMVKLGYGEFYDNRKITAIPLSAISKVLGFEPQILEVNYYGNEKNET